MISKAWKLFVKGTDILIDLLIWLTSLGAILLWAAVSIVFVILIAYFWEITTAIVVFHFVKKYW